MPAGGGAKPFIVRIGHGESLTVPPQKASIRMRAGSICQFNGKARMAAGNVLDLGGRIAFGKNFSSNRNPCWYGMDLNSIKPVLDICEREGVRFIDYANDPKYVHHDFYFKDGLHLNEIGASEFSKDLVKDIQELHIN